MAFLAVPAVATAVTTGAAVVGTALSVVQSQQQARAQEEQAQFQAQVAQNNALIEDANREQAIVDAAVSAQDQARGQRQELGQLIADQGASGLDLGSGSFLRVREGLEAIASVDRERIVRQGQNEADAAASRAAAFRTEAAGFRSAAGDARSSGIIGVGASLVSGAATVAAAAESRVTGGSQSGSRLAPTSSPRPRLRPQIIS